MMRNGIHEQRNDQEATLAARIAANFEGLLG